MTVLQEDQIELLTPNSGIALKVILVAFEWGTQDFSCQIFEHKSEIISQYFNTSTYSIVKPQYDNLRE